MKPIGFASGSITEHALRGVVGFGAIVWAIKLTNLTGPAPLAGSIALGVLALIAFRGCPICWTIGLGQTLFQRRPGHWPGCAR